MSNPWCPPKTNLVNVKFKVAHICLVVVDYILICSLAKNINMVD